MSWKTKERIIWTVFVLVMLWIFYKAACFLFVGLIPEKRTFYLSYSSFLRDADYANFTKELPKTAFGEKYYHRIFLFTYENGYGAVISEDNYEEVKEQYLKEKEEYVNQFVSYVYVNGERIERSEEEKEERKKAWDIYSIHETGQTESDVAETLKQNNIEFFDQVARGDTEGGDYHFLWYWIEDVPGTQFVFSGIIYNDETNEIIEVNYWRMDLSNM